MFFRRSAYLALAAAAVAVNAQGEIDNSQSANELLSKAVALSGNYQIQSESEGTTLTYLHNDQPNIYPSSDPLDTLLKEIEDAFSEPSASQTFLLSPNDDGSNTVRIANSDSSKCLSSQWDFTTGVDGFGVAYQCAVGPGGDGDSSGLETSKQWFLLVPAQGSDDSSSSDDDSSSSSKGSGTGGEDFASGGASATSSASAAEGSTTGCPKSPGWVYRHQDATDYFAKYPACKGTGEAPACTKDKAWLEAFPSYLPDHPECEAVLHGDSSSKAKRHGDRAAHRRRLSPPGAKRSSSGRYNIVLSDHLTDMATRAVSAVETTAFAGAKSAQIVPFDPTDESQVWTIQESS